ncbi:MAG: LamG domain-containing protein, partial [Planctomycetes bacterium]|nr:LamG domain-containing protein [Planctomycetota bacterium]
DPSSVDCDGGKPAVGKWIHLVCTFDGQQARVFQDGVQVALKDCKPDRAPWPGPLFVGQYGPAPSDPYQVKGRLAAVRIYQRALSGRRGLGTEGSHRDGGVTSLIFDLGNRITSSTAIVAPWDASKPRLTARGEVLYCRTELCCLPPLPLRNGGDGQCPRDRATGKRSPCPRFCGPWAAANGLPSNRSENIKDQRCDPSSSEYQRSKM